MLPNPLTLQIGVAVSKAPVGNGPRECPGYAWKSMVGQGQDDARDLPTAQRSAGLCAGGQGWSLAVFSFIDVAKETLWGRYVVCRASWCCVAPVHVSSSAPPSAAPCIAGDANVLSSTCLLGEIGRFGYE